MFAASDHTDHKYDKRIRTDQPESSKITDPLSDLVFFCRNFKFQCMVAEPLKKDLN